MGAELTSLTWSVVPVQDGEGEEGPVTVGGEGGFGQRGHVVHVVEPRAVGVVVARQQQVHVVRRLEEGSGPLAETRHRTGDRRGPGRPAVHLEVSSGLLLVT